MESINQEDCLQIQYLARPNLLPIADVETTNHILDRLDDNENVAMNENFPEIVDLIKFNYLKISKKTFIRLVKEKTFESGDEKPVEMEKTYDSSYTTLPMNENPMRKTPVFTTPMQTTPKKAYTALLKPIEISDPEEIQRYKAILNKFKPLKMIQLQLKVEKILPRLVPQSFTVK
jgi:hypothetical protein